MTRCKYLELVKEQIRCKRVRGAIGEELEAHMDEQKMDFMAEGMTETEAEEAAVCEMGDPVEVGVEMDRIHRPRMPWRMFLWITGISVIGFVLSTMLLYDGLGEGYFNLDMIVKNGLILAAAIAIMAGICLLDYSRIAQYAEAGMIVFLAALVLGLIFSGGMVNGRAGWISLPVIGAVNVSMLLYLGVPLYGAIMYRYRGEGYRGLWKSLFWAVPPVLIAYSRPDVVTAAMLLATFLIMLSVAVYRRWFRVARKKTLAALWMAALTGMAACCGYMLISGATYQAMRLQAMLGMLDGEEPYLMKMIQGVAAECVFFGEGTGKMRLSEIPDIGSYVLTGILVTYGVAAAVLLVSAILLLLFRCFRKSLKQKNQLGMMMGTGVRCFLASSS